MLLVKKDTILNKIPLYINVVIVKMIDINQETVTDNFEPMLSLTKVYYLFNHKMLINATVVKHI